MKRWLLVAMTALIIIAIVLPQTKSYAGPIQDIERQLENIRKQEKEAASKRAEADKLANSLKIQRVEEVRNLDQIAAEILEQGKKLDELNFRLNEINMELMQAGIDLQNAENRIAERDSMMKSRVRLMYMNGASSYLDVLFSATSFADFIDRVDQMKDMVGKDKDILEANERDRDVIVVQKAKVEESLAEMQVVIAQAEEIKQQLLVREKEKEVLIASLEEQEHAAHGISEEQEQSLLDLVKQKSDLQKKLDQEKEKERKRQEAARQTSSGGSVNIGKGGQLGWPLAIDAKMSSDFGYRVDPFKKVRKLHKGIDFAAPKGTNILAADSGVVLIASWVNGYGNTVVVDHRNGMWTWYAHIMEDGILVKEGQEVKRGEAIAKVGSTGDSTGNHLHFEVRVNEVAVDPKPYLR